MVVGIVWMNLAVTRRMETKTVCVQGPQTGGTGRYLTSHSAAQTTRIELVSSDQLLRSHAISCGFVTGVDSMQAAAAPASQLRRVTSRERRGASQIKEEAGAEATS